MTLECVAELDYEIVLNDDGFDQLDTRHDVLKDTSIEKCHRLYPWKILLLMDRVLMNVLNDNSLAMVHTNDNR